MKILYIDRGNVTNINHQYQYYGDFYRELQKKFDSDPKYHGLIAVREDFEPEPEPGYYPDDYSELASNF